MLKEKRRATSFRLPTYLIDGLKLGAKRQNTSMNSPVELLLREDLYSEPNEDTRAAIEECRSGVELPELDTSDLDAFIKSIEQ